MVAVGSVASFEQHRRARVELNDAELVAQALQGDELACRQLYRRHAVSINAMAFRLAPRREDADDLVQESFAAAFDALHRLEKPAAFGAWVRSILVRTAAKQLRRLRIARRIGLAQERAYDAALVIDGAAPAEVVVELRRLYRHLHRMPADAGVALVLKRVEGMTIPEIAEHMGVSVGTVKRRIRRAESRLLAEAVA